MANCPCENEAATCVDSTNPITRGLAGDCVTFGLATNSTDDVALSVNGSGELEATTILSGDAGQLLEKRASGLYAPTPEQTTAANLVCQADDCGDVQSPSTLPNSCNGLEIRTCAFGGCEGTEGTGLWAPPETHAVGFWGDDTGAPKFAFQSGSFPGGYIPSNYGENEGAFASDGYVFRSIPYQSGASIALNLKYQVDNPWCVPGWLSVTLDGFGGKLRFQDPESTWIIDVFGRLYLENSGGGTSITIGGAARVFSQQSVQPWTLDDVGDPVENTDNAGDIAFTVPNVTSKPLRVPPGDYYRVRGEVVFYITQSDTGGGVILSSQEGLRQDGRLRGTLVAAHTYTSTNMSTI